MFWQKKSKGIQKKKDILFNKIDNENNKIKEERFENRGALNVKRKNSITIAVVGTHKGAGCTYTALNIAYELSNNFKVALVELDGTSELQAFNEIYKLNMGQLNSVKLDNLEVYFYGKNKLSEILQQQYDYIVLDAGRLLELNYNTETHELDVLRSDTYEEVCRASYKVLVTELSEWNQRYLGKHIEIENLDNWIIATNMTKKETHTELIKRIKVEKLKVEGVINLQYCENVFECKGYAKQILQEY